MNSRRSFFARMGAAIATIALAPELAFRAKLALPEVAETTGTETIGTFWLQESRYSMCVSVEYEALIEKLHNEHGDKLWHPS